MNKADLCVEAAKEWLASNPDSDPEFSTSFGVVFNENSAADEILEAITTVVEEAGFTIRPEDIILATLNAKAELKVQ